MATQHRSIVVYAGSAIVFVTSFAATWFLPVPDLFRGFASIPGVGAMASVIIQLWREQRAHDRALDVLHRQQDFALATASHMANIAYDKHVLFCEAYIERVNRGLQELMQSGPSKDALNIAGDLIGIRIQHTAWLTAEIESKLIPFEAALRKIGAGHVALEGWAVGEQRSRVVGEIYKSFGLVTGIDKPESDSEAATAVARIVDHVRDILGIHELTALRQTTTRLALRRTSERSESA